MERFDLHCHPDTPSVGIETLFAFVWPIESRDTARSVQFYVRSRGGLALPKQVNAERTDGLWQTTCFELFLQPLGGTRYIEFNLAPSFQWAAYEFNDYRSGMRNLDLAFDPEIAISLGDSAFFDLDSDLDVSSVGAGAARMGLAAVIEETDDTKSYWALAHAPGPPDFHNPACFTATLPPPAAP